MSRGKPSARLHAREAKRSGERGESEWGNGCSRMTRSRMKLAEIGKSRPALLHCATARTHTSSAIVVAFVFG